MISTNYSTTCLPGLNEILKFKSPLATRWQNLLSRISTVTKPTQQREEIFELIVSANKQKATHAYWCPLLQCQPDQGGVRVARIIESTEAHEHALSILQQHFDSDNFNFFASDNQIFLESQTVLPDDWPGVVTILNQNLFDFIIKAKKGIQWHSLLNEVQMLIAQDTILSNYNVNSIWVEPTPFWLNLDDAISENIDIDTSGINLFLASDSEALEIWLDDRLEKIYQKFIKDSQHMLTDGQNFWTCSLLQRMKLKWFFSTEG